MMNRKKCGEHHRIELENGSDHELELCFCVSVADLSVFAQSVHCRISPKGDHMLQIKLS